MNSVCKPLRSADQMKRREQFLTLLRKSPDAKGNLQRPTEQGKT